MARPEGLVFFSRRSHTSSCAFHLGRGSSSKEFPAPSVEGPTLVHLNWRLSLNCRPKQTNIGTLYVSMMGPLCGWQCLQKGNESKCCGSRRLRSLRSLPKRYSTPRRITIKQEPSFQRKAVCQTAPAIQALQALRRIHSALALISAAPVRRFPAKHHGQTSLRKKDRTSRWTAPYIRC